MPDDRVELSDGSSASIWSERVRPTSAEVVATFATGPVAGSPAITRNRFGAGTAWYVATALDEPGLAALVANVLAELAVPVSTPGLEIVTRVSDDARYLFAINHGDVPVTVPAVGTELLTGAEITGGLTVAAGGVGVVRQSTKGAA